MTITIKRKSQPTTTIKATTMSTMTMTSKMGRRMTMKVTKRKMMIMTTITGENNEENESKDHDENDNDNYDHEGEDDEDNDQTTDDIDDSNDHITTVTMMTTRTTIITGANSVVNWVVKKQRKPKKVRNPEECFYKAEVLVLTVAKPNWVRSIMITMIVMDSWRWECRRICTPRFLHSVDNRKLNQA